MEIVENYEDNFLYYQIKVFNDTNLVKHLFTSRLGWSNDNMFTKISDIFNVPKSNIVRVKQVHGTEILMLDSISKDGEELSSLEKDGLITNIPNLVLTTSHADCVPIYFLDKTKKVIGLAHGGWRGTFNNISGKLIDKMKNKYGSNPKDILVAIGPSIGPCCYEVNRDLGDQFTRKYNSYKNILLEKNDGTYLDLWKINFLQAKEKGILEENILLSNTCTSCQVDKFHSYRKEKGTKNRMMAAISLITDMEDENER